jgi:outer membrane protein assembly factor BamD (BamD/ComL family)
MSTSPVTIKVTPEPKPTAQEIHEWLIRTYPVENAMAWATYLEGLSWGYLKPVVQIAVNAHHKHPALVLASAAAHSEDILFKLTARNHIDAKGSV